MRAGQLDRQVVLQTVAISRGETGGRVETWSTVATCWAHVEDANGSQIFQAQGVGVRVTRVVTLRWREGLAATHHRLLIDGVIARINWIKALGRREFLELYCEGIDG